MGAGEISLPLDADGFIRAGKVKVGANKVLDIQGKDKPFPDRSRNLSCEPKGGPVRLHITRTYKLTGATKLQSVGKNLEAEFEGSGAKADTT